MLNTYLKVINHYGKESQLKKAIEELKELSIEIEKAIKGEADIEAIMSEMADVINMLEQLKLMYQISADKLQVEINRKMKRTLARINNQED